MEVEEISEMSDGAAILRKWEEEHSDPQHDPIPILTRLAEIIEADTESYMKMDPDPFDERHPSRADPTCNLGSILKIIFRKDNFMTKLVNDYLRDNYFTRLGIGNRDVRKLNIAACRLMLDLTPGLETSAVFETPNNDALVQRLINWATESPEPLQTYATGLLSAAMEVQEIAVVFRDKNAQLIPLMLQRLHRLQAQACEERRQAVLNSSRPFAHLGNKNDSKFDTGHAPAAGRKEIGVPSPAILKKDTGRSQMRENGIMSPPYSAGNNAAPVVNGGRESRRLSKDAEEKEESDGGGFCPKNVELMEGISHLPETPKDSPWNRSPMMSPPHHIRSKFAPKNPDLLEGVAQLSPTVNPNRSPMMSPPHPTSAVIQRSPFTSGTGNISECSNSSWAEMENVVIGVIQMYPLTLATQQMFILRYLTHMGEYQEFLSHIFENNALELILNLTNLRESRDARLAFEALKYLAALLCHKKFSIEFINMQGLQRLLEVPRPSIAATGVSICLYYLAYCEDAIERVCLLPQHVISDLVRYVLWLLECSHDSGRCHATMFFGLSFQFRVILEEFDAQNGLCKLYNVASTLPIMSTEGEATLNEDQVCSARQIVRHVCVALKRYFEAHLYIRADQLRRAHMRENDDARQMQNTLPSYKASKSSPEEVQEQVETLLELMSFRAHWQPADELLRLGGITMLLQVIAFAYEWNYSGRAETVRSALDVLSICSVMPQVQLLFCEPVTLPDEGLTVGVNIILGAAEGEIVSDPDVQRSALSVIINCVCAPIQRVGGTVARYSGSGYARKKANFRVSEDVIKKMWDSVRANNGIMVLLTLMMVKIPITDADSIRALACRALAGLARSETVRQIISKLPLFSNGLLQNLMQNPILQDKRQEHVRFQKYALELLEQISGKSKPTGNEFEISLANIHKANVIAQTRIQFNDKQLHQLIYEHLMSRGLTESAATLVREAGISAPKLAIMPGTPLTFSYQRSATPSNVRPRLGGSPLIHRPPLASPACNPPPLLRNNSVVSTTPCSSTGTPSLSSGQVSAADTPSSVPIKISLSSQRRTDAGNSLLQSSSSSKSLQKSTSYDPASVVQSPLQKSTSVNVLPAAKQEKHVTLDSIITEYLTNQHALCKNPMAICPQFNLFAPHKCPDPKSKNSAPTNFTMRYLRRPVHPAHGGPDAFRMDRRLVHTRFCPVRTFRPAEDESYFTCCTYLPDNQHLIVGAYRGELKIYNLTNTTETSVQCHESYMFHLMPHKTGKLLLASCTWNSPLSSMWKITPGGGADGSLTMERSVTWDDEEYVEFSKQEQDRVITTNAQTATIYDVETGQVVQTLKPKVSNQYLKNRATFNPTNEIVLSDGILWDVNAGKEIHKLDKLNQNISGIFHPNGLEIVANTEVWDLRTFHLLRTVPTLDQCNLLFSPDGTTIYASTVEQDGEEQDNGLESSFRTLDAYDYSPIATIDVKKNIYNLACNPYGTQIAVVENLGVFDQTEESSVRLYEVGRRRDDEDEVDEEDEEEEMESDDSDDDNLDGGELRDLAEIVGDFSDMDAASDNGDEDDDDDDEDGEGEDEDGDGDEDGDNADEWEELDDVDGSRSSDDIAPRMDLENSSAPSDSADD